MCSLVLLRSPFRSCRFRPHHSSRGLFFRANSAGRLVGLVHGPLNDEPLSTGPGDVRGGDRPVDGESRDAGGLDPETLASAAFPVEGVSDRDRGGGPDHGTPRQASRLVAHARPRLPEGLHARGSPGGPRAGGGDPRRAGRSRPTGFCQNRPGRLRPIAEVLDLPIVALITCRSWSECHLPRLPEGVDAVLLDGLENPEDYDRFRRMVSLTLGKPVLGGVEALPDVREALRHVSRDNPPPEELSNRLAASFLRFADLEAIRALAQSRPFSLPAAEPIRAGRRRFRVAYAQDEAFGALLPRHAGDAGGARGRAGRVLPDPGRILARGRRPRDDRLRLPRPPRRRPGRQPQPDRRAHARTSAGGIGSIPKGGGRPIWAVP